MTFGLFLHYQKNGLQSRNYSFLVLRSVNFIKGIINVVEQYMMLIIHCVNVKYGRSHERCIIDTIRYDYFSRSEKVTNFKYQCPAKAEGLG